MDRPAWIGGPRRNLELKARDQDPTRSLRACAEIGAEDEETLLQTDTYFHVRNGRLKLREEPGADAHLIAYQRTDRSDSRESHYRLVAVQDAAELKQALATTLGIRVVVDKERRLFLYRGVRIHLDRVAHLGDFIEFEGVAAVGADPAKFKPLLAELRQSFAIENSALISASYSDLIEAG